MKEAASLIVRLADRYFNDGQLTRKFNRYELAQEVYDDDKVLSNLELVQDIEPYGVSLIKERVDGLVGRVAGAYDDAEPYFIFKGGTAGQLGKGSDWASVSELREAREHDTHLAYEADNFTFKVHESARLATIKGRAPFRISWSVRRRGEGWQDAEQVKDSDLEFAGPSRETIPPEDFIWYPLYAREVSEVRMIGHLFPQATGEIERLQAAGEYFEVELSPVHEQEEEAEEEEDLAPDLLSVIVRLPVGMDREGPRRAYRCTVHKGQEQMLYMRGYDLPMPDYFAPGMRYDPVTFWPSHSVASSMFESQTMINDARTAQMLEAVARSKNTVFGIGSITEQTTYPLEIGSLVMLRGVQDIKSFPIAGTSGPALEALAEAAKTDADAVSISRTAMGALPADPQNPVTMSGALQGSSDAVKEYARNFNMEEVRAAQFVQMLIQRNWPSFKRFHGDRLRTRRASDWRPQFTISPNGQGPTNNPQLMTDQLGIFVKALDGLGIERAPSDLVLDTAEVARALAQNFSNLNTEKILIGREALPQVPPGEDGAGIGGPLDVERAIPAELPPELLDVLAGAPPEVLAELLGEPALDVPPGAGEVPLGVPPPGVVA